ncbi:MAG: class I SAM-dependent methyltransferase [Candidatus Methanofastidiosia archaeon]|jgi:ubiquinone/menaquinone biosynthesis C-methylase UbiE
MKEKGDTKTQAHLRDTFTKQPVTTPYIYRITSHITPGITLLDIGCGTGHILTQLVNPEYTCIGLDISSAMIQIASKNTQALFVQGNGESLPFLGSTFDIVINRLAQYSLTEVYRVLTYKGFFIEYGLGPRANKEIKNIFPTRINKDAFFFPKTKDWKKEVIQKFEKKFSILHFQEYTQTEYYTIRRALDLIEMVPLVNNFDREKDKPTITRIAENSTLIKTTWHYYMVEAQKL